MKLLVRHRCARRPAIIVADTKFERDPISRRRLRMHMAAASTPCALGRDLRHERDARGATAALAYGDLEADWETPAATGDPLALGEHAAMHVKALAFLGANEAMVLRLVEPEKRSAHRFLLIPTPIISASKDELKRRSASSFAAAERAALAVRSEVSRALAGWLVCHDRCSALGAGGAPSADESADPSVTVGFLPDSEDDAQALSIDFPGYNCGFASLGSKTAGGDGVPSAPIARPALARPSRP